MNHRELLFRRFFPTPVSFPLHTFHIPVMGTGFTIDTPLKVGRFGISSVVSLGDDRLIEEARAYHAQRLGKPHTPIGLQEPDARARRITAYLNLLNDVVAEQIEALRQTSFENGEIVDYFEMLPEESPLKARYLVARAETDPEERARLENALRPLVRAGDIDVNIMTKLDRDTRPDGSPRPAGESDALSALRGFAQSRLRSSVVFSAGLNPRLFSYTAEFPEFFPDAHGAFGKKIILKVSDFRSALTQGKLLAKKGLWVSEFRIESGLNCGGHAFATDGELLGPVLSEFKQRRHELTETLYGFWRTALRSQRGQEAPPAPAVRITAQGGLGTAEEDGLLRSFYGLDGTGWGSLFLLVPEATTVDEPTLSLLSLAREKDIGLSGSSPMGVLFHTLKNSASEEARRARIAAGTPGSPCLFGTVAFNKEFPGPPLCTASQTYQTKKLAQLSEQGLDPETLFRERERVLEKACICRDLGDGARLCYDTPLKRPLTPAVCPGPNLAYFSKVCGLREMVDHIYGRTRLPFDPERPHQLLKELELYVDYLKNRLLASWAQRGEKERVRAVAFRQNLLAGIDHYQKAASRCFDGWLKAVSVFRERLSALQSELENISIS